MLDYDRIQRDTVKRLLAFDADATAQALAQRFSEVAHGGQAVCTATWPGPRPGVAGYWDRFGNGVAHRA